MFVYMHEKELNSIYIFFYNTRCYLYIYIYIYIYIYKSGLDGLNEEFEKD